MRPDPSLGACPSWCELPAGHAWEDEWTYGPMREHVRILDRIDEFNVVRLSEYQHWGADGTPLRERGIHLDLDTGEHRGAEAAQRLITALSTGVDLLNTE